MIKKKDNNKKKEMAQAKKHKGQTHTWERREKT
jgi:hypothetical protein